MPDPRRRSGSTAARLLLLLGLGAAGPGTVAAQPIPSQRAWQDVLRDRVDGQGRVDFAGLQADPAALDAYVGFVAITAPASIADRPARLAFLINSYNALAMHHVLAFGMPVRLDLLGRARFFKFSKETVGGERVSLYDYENDVIRPLGDERVHFALNCMSVSCPRLPRTPFTAAGLDRELDEAARRFFAEPRNVEVDQGRQVVRLSAILDFYTADFLRRAPSLVAYVNLYRTPPIPAGFRVEFLQYDWTINRQPGPG